MHTDKIVDYINSRLISIQKKYNFPPNVKLRDVPDNKDAIKHYHQFKELVRLIEKTNLDVDIPYDESGESPTEKCVKLTQRDVFVYFCQEGFSTTWKIGYSTQSFRRIKAVQTGNPNDLHLRYEVPGSFDLEQSLHRYLKNFRIKGRSKEWFDLDPAMVENIVKRLKNGEDFYTQKALKNET